MAAHLGRAFGNAKIELIARAFRHRLGFRHVLGLEGDALVHIKAIGAGAMWHPLAAIKAGVEMDMSLDEARKQQIAGKVDRRGRCRAGRR